MSLTEQDRKRLTQGWNESSCVYPDPETGGYIKDNKHTYDWTDICILCGYPRWGRCRLCGKPLTKNEQTVLIDQCNDCSTEINIDVHDE